MNASEILEPDYINHTAFPDWHAEVQAMICEVTSSATASWLPQLTAANQWHRANNELMRGEVLHMWRIANGRLAEG